MFGNHMNIQTPGLLRLVDDREVDGKKLDILQGTWSIIRQNKTDQNTSTYRHLSRVNTLKHVKTTLVKILLLPGINQELVHYNTSKHPTKYFYQQS